MENDNSEQEVPRLSISMVHGGAVPDKEDLPPATLIVSDDVEQTLINIYAPLMAIYYGNIDMVNEVHANSIARFVHDIHPEQYRLWHTSETGKRLKCYEFDGPDDPKTHFQEEWMEKIKNELLDINRKRHPVLVDWDINWWDGLVDDEKLAIFTLDLAVWNAAFNDYRERNKPEYNYQTTEHVKTWFPCFGNPDGGRDYVGEMDRPLPFELLRAVSEYVLKRWNENEDKTSLIREIRGVGNFNTFIREKIEAREF